MSAVVQHEASQRQAHAWLRRIQVALVPGPQTPLLERFTGDLLQHFERLGHEVQPQPDDHTDLVLTTARFGEPVGWREAPIFTVRRRFGLSHLPTFIALVGASPLEFQRALDGLRVALAKESPDPADFSFPGLAPQSYRVLIERPGLTRQRSGRINRDAEIDVAAPYGQFQPGRRDDER